MIEQKQYDVLWGAFTLACDMLSKVNIEVSDNDVIEAMEYKIHGSLKGYFLMKAEDLLEKKKE